MPILDINDEGIPELVVPYVPHKETLKFMIWIKRYLPPLSNQTAKSHYKLIDYYFDAEPDGINMAEVHRGWGKSQWNMLYSLYLVCEGLEPYVLFVGGTQDLTNDLIASAADMLKESNIPNVSVRRSVEGVLEIFTATGDIGYLVAKSTGSKLRGVAKGRLRERPSLIVLDDIVDDQLVMNRLRMARANKWITSALLPTLSPGGKMIGSGTPMNQADPFMTLVKQFGSYKIPLSDTSFPDRFTSEFIARKKLQYEKLGRLRDWKREFELVLVDDETQLFNMKQVEYVDKMPGNVVCYMTIDAAISEKAGADYTGIIINGIDSDGKWNIYPVQKKLKPSELAGEIIELVVRFNILNVGIEQGATYLALIEHLSRLRAETNIWFNVEELKHGGFSKISRVKSLEPVVNSGIVNIVDNGDDAEALVEQMELTDMEAINSAHDDLIDPMAYQVQIIRNYTRYYDEDEDEDNLLYDEGYR